MASTLAKPIPHQRQPSRSNSLSSSSVITVQRAASLTRIGTRPSPVSTLRSQSPTEYDLGPATFRSNRTLSPDPHRRSSTIHSHSDSVTGIREGVGNLNRWSQSTSSSKSSATNNNNRRNSFSRRLSGSFGTFSGFASSQSPPPHRIVLAKSRTPPASSPLGTIKALPPAPTAPSPPPIITIPALSKAVDAADSPSTVATVTPTTADLLTPSIYPSGSPDYFGEKWKGRSPPNKRVSVQRPKTVRSPIAQPSLSNRDIWTESSESLRPIILSDSAASSKAVQRPSPTAHRKRDQASRPGHSRNGGEAGKGSGGTEDESSASSTRSDHDRGRRRRPPSQKAMLSKALQKANHAVLLDNAQNFEGAMDAYEDACDLLQQVMTRSSGDDDRRKLQAIRNTYTNRIAELQAIDSLFQTADGKALPKRPISDSSKDQEPFSPITEDGEGLPEPGAPAVVHIVDDQSRITEATEPLVLTDPSLSSQWESTPPSAFEEEYFASAYNPSSQHLEQNSWSRHHLESRVAQTGANLAPPMVPEYMPPPLSPRRPLSPMPLDKCLISSGPPATTPSVSESGPLNAHPHARNDIAESTSWLDTIDESGGSSESSVHSRSSSIGLRRKHIRAPSGATEAAFDAALDAAVEAAYADGFEPAEEYDKGAQSQANIGPYEGGAAWNARLSVELAKQRARAPEREAAMASTQTFEKMGLHGIIRTARDSIELEYGSDEAEEEERMLEEMTRGYIMDDSEYDLQSKSALPRQSDSSGFSGRTWGSSIASHRTTAGTSLSTVAESTFMPSMAKQLQAMAQPPPPHPPPSGALPPPPPPPTAMLPRPPSLSTSPGPGVRDRRLSGQNAKQLKIDTNAKSSLAPQSPKIQPLAMLTPTLPIQATSELPKPASAVLEPEETMSSMSFQPAPRAAQSGNRQVSSPLPGPSPADSLIDYPPTPMLTKVSSVDSEDALAPIQSSPARGFNKVTSGAGTLRKNFSSSNLRSRGLTASNSDLSDGSAGTPISALFSMTTVSQRNAPTTGMATTSTPLSSTFNTNAQPPSGMYLFDNDIHSPINPGTPNAEAADAPMPLESCPESFLLRPFWLMRCVYQNIAHSRGGYLSKRLFIPREIWRVKNVKLKGVEEKVSNLDLLTAALLKLANVDTLDADALLEEMQSFEIVLDQVQVNLSKKLGSEVGVQGSAVMFKGSSATDDTGSAEVPTLKTTNMTSKSYLSSWRKLRSKTSSSQGSTLPIAVSSTKDGFREGLVMSSLPMTSLATSRPAKRVPSQVQCIGPNANYMGALARLCDAAQILDQIARQVEDPGLKHSSQTHVGLELSTRHAAEFFGFFICRFVLSDVGMMLDKFIKRESEWVLS